MIEEFFKRGHTERLWRQKQLQGEHNRKNLKDKKLLGHLQKLKLTENERKPTKTQELGLRRTPE